MNTIKMLWAMLTGLFHMNKFKGREEFWDWYWEQIPDARYPGESLYEAWDTFKWVITGQPLWWEISMWYKQHFSKKQFGYSWTFNKNGYFFKKGNTWWFIPEDKSFTYGTINDTEEWTHKNPIFN